MNNISSKQKKKIPLALKVLLIITGTILLLAIIFCIWFFFPMSTVPSYSLITPDTMAYFSFNFDSKNPGIIHLKTKAKEVIQSSNMGTLQKTLIGWAFSSFLPKNVSGIITSNKETGKPKITGIVGFGNEIKLIQLFNGYIDKALFSGLPVLQEKEAGHNYTIPQIPDDSEQDAPLIGGYSFIGNNLCLGTDASLLRGIIQSYKSGGKKQEGIAALAAGIAQNNRDNNGYFIMDNSDNSLSGMIRTVEEKFTFAAFPSIDAVESITGSLSLTPEEFKGVAWFECRNPERVDEIRADVKFFYQALRRLFRPQNLSLKGKISIKNDTVVFDFNINNFIENIFEQFKNDQGGDNQ